MLVNLPLIDGNVLKALYTNLDIESNLGAEVTTQV